MSRDQKLDKILDTWAKKWKEENLSKEIRRLLNQTYFDLYQGPTGNSEDYPGFTTAIKNIRSALDDVPGNLYIDTDTDEILDSEPKWEKCIKCNGSGEAPNDFEHAEGGKCPECDGQCGFPPFGDWWHIEREDILKALVGDQLAAYIR